MAYQDIHNFSQSDLFYFSKLPNKTLMKTTLANYEDTKMTKLEEIMNTLYVVLTGIFSTLSMIGTMIIIITYIYYPEIRSRGRHFLVYLSVADFLTAFGNLLGVIWTTDPHSFSDAFCEASPAITAFSSVSSYLWNVCMAVYLYLTLVKGYHHLVHKLKMMSHSICWLVPSK